MTKDLAIVGEAYGEEEERTGIAFFGKAGQELSRMLSESGIDRDRCFITNVFNRRPPNNDLKSFCLSKIDASRAYASEHLPRLAAAHPEYDWPKLYTFPPLCGPGKFLHPSYLGELARLRGELEKLKPKLVLALGNTPCWALLGRTGIGKLRGYIYQSTLLPGGSVLPTYHPAAILRQWSQRPIGLADFAKAKKFLEDFAASGAAPARVSGTLWLEPTIEDCELWWSIHVGGQPSKPLSIDIETNRGLITAVGFGVRDSAISIPFRDRRRGTGSYWESPEAEARAWGLVRAWFASPNPKVFQNAIYDLSYLWGKMGLLLCGRVEDTMLQHHALHPELAKDLGFLGGTYTDNIAWKNLRKQADMKAKAEKKDE